MTTASIEDVPLINAGSIRWALRDGVRPVVETFSVTPAGATVLRDFAPGPVNLRMDVGEDGELVEFTSLYIVGFPPGPNPHIQAVELADRRWMWPSSHILRRFNMRRRIGNRRVTEPNLPVQLQPVTPELAYKRFSLSVPNAGFNGRWLGVKDAFQNVMEEVLAKEFEAFGSRGRIVIRDFTREIPIENLVIDDDGASAINRLLAYFPEAAIFISPNGDVVIYSKASGADEDSVFRAGAEIVGSGHVEKVDDRFVRPRQIEVLFSREVEVRLDFRSGGTSTIVATTGEDQIPGGASGIDNDLLENVLPLPDYRLTIGGTEQIQGNWVAINTNLLNAWGAPPGASGPIRAQDLRQDAIPFIDQYFNRIQRLGQVDTTANWLPRIAALRQHYRKTFRIHENLMDRVVALKAERVGNVNFSTGQRAPAVAYGDWAVVVTPKYFYRDNVEDTSYTINHSSFASGAFSIIQGSEPGSGAERTAGSKPMPANITIVDQDQGIISIDYALDPYGIFQQVLPGNVENGPSGDVADARNKNVAFNATTRSNLGRPIQLDSDYRLTVILTASPGAPNSGEQLQKVVIRPEQVLPLLPPSLRFNPAEASGPTLSVRVGPGVETARIPWSDRFASEIFSQFGLGGDPKPIDSLVVNMDAATSVESGASLNRIALAEAARIYASHADRYRGQAAMRIRPGIEPGGSLSEVVFELDKFGVGTIQLSFPERFDPLNFFTLLDASTRSVILQLSTHLS